MVKVERISPNEDMTLEITAPMVAWRNVAAELMERGKISVGDTKKLIEAMLREIDGP